MNNLSSYCGLVGAKIRASDKDLPVCLDFLRRTHVLKKNLPHVFDFYYVNQLICQNQISCVSRKVRTLREGTKNGIAYKPIRAISKKSAHNATTLQSEDKILFCYHIFIKK